MARIRRVLRGQRVTFFLLVITAGLFVALAADGYWDGRCYNEVLSPDPMQCYVLEQAEADDVIEVDGIYTNNRGTLYVFYSYLPKVIEHPTVDLTPKLRSYGLEYAEEHPSLAPYSRVGEACQSATFGGANDTYDSLAECGATLTFDYGRVEPRYTPYAQILLYPGGNEARQDINGWASWTQVWPRASRSTRNTGGDTTSSGGFDISDVDFDNIPEVGCSYWGTLGDSCSYAEGYPELPIAGGYTYEYTRYMHVKAESTDDPIFVDAKELLLDRSSSWAIDGEGTKSAYEEDYSFGLVVVPAQYSYSELWRHAHILERFSRSSGNTLGINGAIILYNGAFIEWYFDESVILTPGLVAVDEYDPESNFGREAKEFIAIQSAHDDLERIVDALPVLLPQLGIPSDVVGMVGYNRPRAGAGGIPAIDISS